MKTRNAAHFNNRGWRNYACLRSQFRIAKFWCSAKQLLKMEKIWLLNEGSFIYLSADKQPLDFICTLQ